MSKDIYWIAEIGSNHNQSMKRALALIDRAKGVGASAVKFQCFKAEKLYAPQHEGHINAMRQRELDLNVIPELSQCALRHDIDFGISVFHVEDVELLAPYVDFLKIASYEATNLELIRACYETGKRIIISTGAISSKDTIEINEIDRAGRIKFLHCVSKYPAMPNECNLRLIEASYCLNGWSDHTCQPGVIHKAIGLGAEIIEFHFDLYDELGVESIHGHCWTPEKIAEVIKNVRIGQQVVGTSDWNVIEKVQEEARQWRADPETGLRGLNMVYIIA